MRTLTTCTLLLLVLLAAASPVAAQGWQPLFDGQSLRGWMTLDGQPVTKGWEASGGAIHLNVAGGRAGDIVTDVEYEDYQLLFEWKIAAGGNSGVKYRVKDFGGKTLGCEYQLYDDQEQGLPARGSTGSLYDIYEPAANKPLNPAGHFNRSLVVVRGNHVEHWLNGTLIVQAEVGSDEWRRRVAESKFADVPGFGENRRGRIMLTDHGSEVWYRNVFLMPLSAWRESHGPAPVASQGCPDHWQRPAPPRPRHRRILGRQRLLDCSPLQPIR